MKSPTPTQTVLTVLWIVYAAVTTWVFLQDTSQVQQTLLLVLGGFAVVAGILTVVLLLRSDGPDDDRPAEPR